MTAADSAADGLKPCPFCGDLPTIVPHRWSGHGEGGTLYKVECKCGASVRIRGGNYPYNQTEVDAKINAPVAWNRRALPPAVTSAADLQAKLDERARDAARWNWASPILSGESGCSERTLIVGAGLMRNETPEQIIDAAIAAATKGAEHE